MKSEHFAAVAQMKGSRDDVWCGYGKQAVRQPSADWGRGRERTRGGPHGRGRHPVRPLAAVPAVTVAPSSS